MPRIHIFEVKPRIPEEMESLKRLAYNLRWAWEQRCQDLFKRLDPDLWENLNHNPVALLGRVGQKRYDELRQDEGFLDSLRRAADDLNEYLEGRSWFKRVYPHLDKFRVAYFSAEFGLHACMPVYSGGLGILAGDHLKSCSDLGIPLVAVGLLYQKGYFQQYLNADGWQQEAYTVNDYANMPVKLMEDEKGEPYKIKVEFPQREVHIQCWKVEVGRVPLYLLDTNIPENNPDDQNITDELYGGDLEKRIQQEIVLGIGGYRMLDRIGLAPDVYHMNEGHSAFLAVDRIKDLMEKQNLTFNEAKEASASGNIFTTHTPVPAGNDVFTFDLIRKYFSDFCGKIGLDINGFMNLGRVKMDDSHEGFCMTVMALKLANRRNGVSELHGETSRKMWKDLWPEVPLNEIPITHITNGVHPATWMSSDMRGLLDRYLGPSWQDTPHDEELWQRIDSISDEELWRTHERGRERLVAFVRPRLKKQLISRGASKAEIRRADEALNPEYLTIGFARRFATYKRATLIFKDPSRLKRIITNKDRPVQFIFAGKAHPKDEPGKELIRNIIHFARDPEVRNRIVFIENYDFMVARRMLQGIDIWLNTPRRPLEASGTSGMKAAFNGALNVSVLDGWWSEGFQPSLGWAIGKGEEYQDTDLQDEIETNALYDLLEQDIIPTFYTTGRNGKSREWVKYMKESMKKLCPQFSTNRMTYEYFEKFYREAGEDFSAMIENNSRYAKEIASWKDNLQRNWRALSFKDVTSPDGNGHKVDDEHTVSVTVNPGELTPEDISVEIYFGKVNEKREVVDGEAYSLDFEAINENGTAVFVGKIPLRSSGKYGFMARIVPNRKKVPDFLPGLITWE